MTPNQNRDLSDSLHEDLANPDKSKELPNNEILDASIKPLQDELNQNILLGGMLGSVGVAGVLRNRGVTGANTAAPTQVAKATTCPFSRSLKQAKATFRYSRGTASIVASLQCQSNSR